MNKKIIYFAVGIIFIGTILLILNRSTDIYGEIYPEGQNNKLEIVTPWNETSLTDVLTGQEYKISDFSGQVVILESFAVWCPTCRKQQEQIKKLIESGDESIHISIDVDPNEDKEQVINHAQKNGFTWKFSIFPIDATKSLIKEFGQTIVNAPQAPVIIVCPDGNSRLLQNGVKTAEELSNEISKC